MRVSSANLSSAFQTQAVGDWWCGRWLNSLNVSAPHVRCFHPLPHGSPPSGCPVELQQLTSNEWFRRPNDPAYTDFMTGGETCSCCRSSLPRLAAGKAISCPLQSRYFPLTTLRSLLFKGHLTLLPSYIHFNVLLCSMSDLKQWRLTKTKKINKMTKKINKLHVLFKKYTGMGTNAVYTKSQCLV